MNTTAQRARDLALKNHREEVHGLKQQLDNVLKSEHGYVEKLIKERDDHRASKNALTLFKGLFALAVVCVLIMGWAWPSANSSAEKPPPFSKLRVISDGYMDDKGVYRSYSNGEPLDPQPTEWKLP